MQETNLHLRGGAPHEPFSKGIRSSSIKRDGLCVPVSQRTTLCRLAVSSTRDVGSFLIDKGAQRHQRIGASTSPTQPCHVCKRPSNPRTLPRLTASEDEWLPPLLDEDAWLPPLLALLVVRRRRGSAPLAAPAPAQRPARRRALIIEETWRHAETITPAQDRLPAGVREKKKQRATFV